MGQFRTGSRVSKRLTELPCYQHIKMSPFFVLALAAAASARPQGPALPAGLSFAQCINYPFCDQTSGFLEVPAVPGAEDVIRAQEQIIVGNNSPLAALPGIEAHAAAENAVLLSQGRISAGVPAAHLAHFQAEQA